jgi:hypothetical protein
VVAHDYDVLVGVQFLMGASGDVAHGNMLGALQVRGFEFPRFTHVEQGEDVALLLQGFRLAGRDFEVHRCL